MSDLKITLDVSAVPNNPAGAGKYIVELARQLSKREDITPIFIARTGDKKRWAELPGDSHVLDIAPKFRPTRLLWEQTVLPLRLSRIAPSLHHGPHYTIPELASVPLVSTIHDMTFFDHPEWHERVKVPIFRRAIQKAAQKSTALIAVSNDTARRLQERFGTLPVTAIPLAVDHNRFYPAADDDEIKDRQLLDESGIVGDFVAFIGTIEPRKDVPTLLRAFDLIAASFPKLQLVIAGGSGWGASSVNVELSRMQYSNRVIRTGYLPARVVPALLRQARAVAYPSLVEGFGLPALEALAVGAPLITTRGSAMEEVVGDAALLIDPGDTEALAKGLASLLEGVDVERLRVAGPQVAAHYTWQRVADAHVEVYKRALKSAF